MDDDLDEDIADLMTFLRPDPSGNRGGNPAASRTLARDPKYPYDRPVRYGQDPQSSWEVDEIPSLADHFGLQDDGDEPGEVVPQSLYDLLTAGEIG